eukprot:1159488-Pelagomonas_calceolata.AAC.10
MPFWLCNHATPGTSHIVASVQSRAHGVQHALRPQHASLWHAAPTTTSLTVAAQEAHPTWEMHKGAVSLHDVSYRGKLVQRGAQGKHVGLVQPDLRVPSVEQLRRQVSAQINAHAERTW